MKKQNQFESKNFAFYNVSIALEDDRIRHENSTTLEFFKMKFTPCCEKWSISDRMLLQLTSGLSTIDLLCSNDITFPLCLLLFQAT